MDIDTGQKRSSSLSWLRWLAFLPIAWTVHEVIMALYPPVGAFLGGWFGFWPWLYLIAALCFCFVAALFSVACGMAIAPRNQTTVGLIVAGVVLADALSRATYFRNPQWSTFFTITYLLTVLAGVAIAIWLVDGLVRLMESEAQGVDDRETH